MARKTDNDAISPDDSLASAAARIVAERAERMLALRGSVLDPDDVDAVHDLRVAARRLSTVLEIFEPCFAGKPRKRVLREVRGVTKGLGARRDLDVQLQLLRPIAASASAADRQGIESLIASRIALREKAQAGVPEVVERLDGDGFRGDLSSLSSPRPRKAAKRAKPVKHLDPEAPIRANARLILDVRAKSLCKLGDAAAARPDPDSLHATRIAAKHLRYAIHALGFCFNGRLDPAHDRARTLQDVLGALHDYDVLLEAVVAQTTAARAEDALAIAPHASAGDEPLPWSALRGAPHRNEYAGLAKLATLLAARRLAALERFLELWEPLSGGELRAELRSAVSEDG